MAYGPYRGVWYFFILTVFSAACLRAKPVEAAFSSDNAGTAGAQFLSLGVGARALGMGEAMAAVPDSLYSLHWNPAGLAELRSHELALTHAQIFTDFYHDFLAYGRPVRPLQGTLAASLNLLNQSGITAVSNTGQSLPGSFNPYSGALSVGYARSLGSLKAGLAVKGIQESLYDERAHAVAADGGLLCSMNHGAFSGTTLGFAFRNLGTKERFLRQSFPLPFEMGLGASYALKPKYDRGLILASELALPYYGRIHSKFGLEYQVVRLEKLGYAFRLGYKTLTASDLGPLSGLTVGVGAGLGRFAFDFGFEPMQGLGQIFMFGMRYRLP